METMVATIKLAPDIAEQITHLAEESQVSADLFVDNALRKYLAHFRHEKIRGETEAFNQQRAKLLTRFLGEYVAVHNGQCQFGTCIGQQFIAVIKRIGVIRGDGLHGAGHTTNHAAAAHRQTVPSLEQLLTHRTSAGGQQRVFARFIQQENLNMIKRKPFAD